MTIGSGTAKHALAGSDAARISRLGEALYGPAWAAALARAIGNSPVVVHRWPNGLRPVPARVWVQLADLARQRIPLFEEIEDRLIAAGVDDAKHAYGVGAEPTPMRKHASPSALDPKHGLLAPIGRAMYDTPAWKAAMAIELNGIAPELFESRRVGRVGSGEMANGARVLGRIATGVQEAPEGFWPAVRLLVAQRRLALLDALLECQQQAA